MDLTEFYARITELAAGAEGHHLYSEGRAKALDEVAELFERYGPGLFPPETAAQIAESWRGAARHCRRLPTDPLT